MTDQQTKPETDKAPRRKLSVEEKLIMLRDSKRKALGKIRTRRMALESDLFELRNQERAAEAELERIQSACPAEPAPVNAPDDLVTPEQRKADQEATYRNLAAQ